MSNIIGDSICVLRVKVEVETGFDEIVAERIASLQDDVKSGVLDKNYPYSLIEHIKEKNSKYYKCRNIRTSFGDSNTIASHKDICAGKQSCFLYKNWRRQMQ